MHLGTPPPGGPVEAPAGLAAVYGHISVLTGDGLVPPVNPGADWSTVGIAPRAELLVHLLRLDPRRTTLPPVLDDGLFVWWLAPGDYLLVAMPAEDRSEEPLAQHHWPLAGLRVPPGPGVTCAGDLVVDTQGDTLSLHGELKVNFGVGRAEVANACAARLADVARHYAAPVAPVRTALMVSAGDLAFEDAGLAEKVKARLDAVPK